MSKFKFLFAALLALAAQLLLAAPAYAKWLRGETRHFIIYSSGSAKELQRFGAHLERFDRLVHSNFKIEDDANPNKLVVYFMTSQDQVAKLAGDKSGGVAGFYSPRLAGSFAVANRERADNLFELDGMTVLFHEYAHHFMFRNFTYAYPAWYVEGFAEFLSTATFKDNGQWTMGMPAYHRAYGLFAGGRLPIDKLLFGNPADLKPEQEDVFYGRSWLFVHMLTMRPEYKGKLSAYFTLIDQGKPAPEAATEVFGDLKVLDKTLDKYAEGRLSYIDSKKPIDADTAMTVAELDPVASQVLLFSLDRLLDRSDAKSLAKLRELAAANPRDANVWYELALSERDLGGEGGEEQRAQGEKRAESAVDQALAANPDHVRANVLKADILMKRLRDAGDDNAAHWSAARKFLVTANAHANDDPLVLFTYYRSFRYQGKSPTKNARDALARAFELEPEVVDVRVEYALDLADQGLFDEAIRLVQFLVHDPHLSKEGKVILEQLEEMRDQAKKAEKTETPGNAGKPRR